MKTDRCLQLYHKYRFWGVLWFFCFETWRHFFKRQALASMTSPGWRRPAADQIHRAQADDDFRIISTRDVRQQTDALNLSYKTGTVAEDHYPMM